MLLVPLPNQPGQLLLGEPSRLGLRELVGNEPEGICHSVGGVLHGNIMVMRGACTNVDPGPTLLSGAPHNLSALADDATHLIAMHQEVQAEGGKGLLLLLLGWDDMVGRPRW
ncbi:unnamed protein product [Meganyctiphanes norvegica]|uniref:Uncharacterized protein n=2 Tax=Meganyctiphanes norvegica TaxID=48144 RepID=A0AAV2RDC0_MEGNR